MAKKKRKKKRHHTTKSLKRILGKHKGGHVPLPILKRRLEKLTRIVKARS